MWGLAIYHPAAYLFPVYSYTYRLVLQKQRTFLRIYTIGESQILSFVSLCLWVHQKQSSYLSCLYGTPGQKLIKCFFFFKSLWVLCFWCGHIVSILMYFGRCFKFSPQMFSCFQWQVWSELPNLPLVRWELYDT